MNDTQTDDAPLATSKEGSEAVAAEASSVPDAKGNALVGRAITIDRPADELYSFFRDFANLPQFMENVVSIDVLDDTRSHWLAHTAKP